MPVTRIGWLDLVKVVAAWAVVTTHIASIGWQVLPVSGVAWGITSVYEIATRFCVPCFWMVSGALLLDPAKEVNIKRLLLHRGLRLLVLTLGVSLAFIVCEQLLYGWNGWRAAIVAALDGPYFIWYLWVLLGLYLLVPVLRCIASSRNTLFYATAVLAVLVLGKSTAQSMVPDSIITILFNNIAIIARGMEGIVYFLLGALLVHHDHAHVKSKAIFIVGFVALIAAIGANYLSAQVGGADLYYVARDNVLIALYSVAVFLLLARYGEHLGRTRIVAALARYGLAIYLIHPFVRLALEGLVCFSPLITWLLQEPLLSVPLVSTGVWLASAICAWTVSYCFQLALTMCKFYRGTGSFRDQKDLF